MNEPTMDYKKNVQEIFNEKIQYLDILHGRYQFRVFNLNTWRFEGWEYKMMKTTFKGLHGAVFSYNSEVWAERGVAHKDIGQTVMTTMRIELLKNHRVRFIMIYNDYTILDWGYPEVRPNSRTVATLTLDGKTGRSVYYIRFPNGEQRLMNLTNYVAITAEFLVTRALKRIDLSVNERTLSGVNWRSAFVKVGQHLGINDYYPVKPNILELCTINRTRSYILNKFVQQRCHAEVFTEHGYKRGEDDEAFYGGYLRDRAITWYKDWLLRRPSLLEDAMRSLGYYGPLKIKSEELLKSLKGLPYGDESLVLAMIGCYMFSDINSVRSFVTDRRWFKLRGLVIDDLVPSLYVDIVSDKMDDRPIGEIPTRLFSLGTYKSIVHLYITLYESFYPSEDILLKSMWNSLTKGYLNFIDVFSSFSNYLYLFGDALSMVAALKKETGQLFRINPERVRAEHDRLIVETHKMNYEGIEYAIPLEDITIGPMSIEWIRDGETLAMLAGRYNNCMMGYHSSLFDGHTAIGHLLEDGNGIGCCEWRNDAWKQKRGFNDAPLPARYNSFLGSVAKEIRSKKDDGRTKKVGTHGEEGAVAADLLTF